MITLSAPHEAAVTRRYTEPGYLVRIDFATPIYLSTRDVSEWDGHTWVTSNVRVNGLSQDGRGVSNGTLELGNADLAWSALILGEGIADRRIRIWSFDAAATDTADVQPAFDGVGDDADITNPAKAVVNLIPQSSRTSFSPRRFIGTGTGFNHLSPAGKIIRIGQDVLTLERN